ncbi:Deleted in lung and esophageal cancer protein 1 [Anthophora plagiata]
MQNACPADIKMLKYCTDVVQDKSRSEDKVKPTNADYEEEEAHLGTPSELIEVPQVRIWDEYKKLVEASRLRPRSTPPLKPELSNVTSFPRIRINSGFFKAKPWIKSQVKRSIIRMDLQQRVLVVNTNYVQFHNFELKKVYKKIVTLQNVSNVPARFQIQPRPYRSKFCVIVNPIVENRSIVPPGMQLQLIVLFRSDDFEEPEEMLILNVQHGRSLTIRLHAYRDPPILFGTCMLETITCKRSDTDTRLVEQTWNSEVVTSFDSTNSSTTDITQSVITWNSTDDDFVSTTFDCKKSFVGEKVYIPIKFENAGGEGRFFIMSESDWFTMDIKDITNTNVLKLSCFAISPAYFSLKANEEIVLHIHFSPDCYGIHPFEKVWPSKRNIDKRAKYYVNLNTSVPDGIGQCVIFVSNVSEVCMNFKWQKRDAQNDEGKINEENYFPLEHLHVKPDRGTFTPTSVHTFTISAEYKNLDPNYYVAILQLYVEDIPLEAISNISEVQTKKCTKKRRKCSASVDIWVAEVEVWLNYMMNDESITNESSEEILKRVTEMSLDYEYLQRDQEEEEEKEEEEEEEEERETTHETEYTEERRSTYQLVLDELFSHYDLVDLKQFEPLWQEQIISMGVIRPTRTLFIGIEETYVLMLKNLTNNSLNYSWGEVNGLDTEKMKLCVCPEKGEVSAGDAQRMEITFTPIKEGFVQSLFMPCFVGDSRKIIMLGIECSIEPLYVTFYFPIEGEESLELSNNFIQVEWRVDSLKHALDMAGKSKKHMKILDKYRMREERELMNTNLDQGEVLKDASAGPSMYEVGAEESYMSTSTSEIIQTSGLMTQSIVPVFDKMFPLPEQPVVIEFLGLPLRTVKKKTFIIKNETSIPTNFRLRIKNFYPITCSCEGKMQEDRIKIIYKRVRGQQKRLIEETLDKVKQPESGVVIYVDPLNSEIGPFQAIPIDVYVFADTWGIYVDEFEINITGLPQYIIGICVQVIGSPISLSISDKNEFNIPVVKYGTEPLGVRLEDRKIVLKNTSIVPIVIDWHTFIVKPSVETMPFNVAFDICTPFTNKLATEMRASKQKSDSEMHLEKHKNIESKFRGLHTCDSIEISSISDPTPNYSGSSHMDISWMSHNETSDHTDISFEYPRKSDCEYLEDNLYEYSNTIDQTDSEETNDIEFKFSIVPYYGLIDTKICTVSPKEMFILPKDNASLIISIQYEKYKAMYNMRDALQGEFICKILGFLRIAPNDMYRDNYYARQTGYYLPPIEIDITANLIKPKLHFDISKFDRTFTCFANDVMLSRKKKLELTKTFFLYNIEDTIMEIDLETYDPFHISSVSIYNYTNSCKSGIICVNARGCVEVEIMCVIEAHVIQTILHTSSNEELHDSKIILTEPLYILHSDRSYQIVELILQICLPILKLSLYTLDFGTVYIGDTKKRTLTIKNLSCIVTFIILFIYSLKFTLNKKTENKDFMLDQKEGELSGYCVNEDWYSTITISFQPKNPGQSVETLEVVSDIPYNIEECQLCGEATLDEKYHTPGV